MGKHECRGGKEARAGTVMRIMGGLEMGSDWCFVAMHINLFVATNPTYAQD